MTSKYEIYNPILKQCKLLQQHHALPPGEGVPNKVLYRAAPPRGPTPYPLKYHYDRKGSPFRLPSFDKIWYNPFHIPSLELCIPF